MKSYPILFLSGSQVPPTDPGAEAGRLHPVGPRQHPGGAVPQVTLRADRPPRVGADAGQPHLDRQSLPEGTEGLRQAEEARGIHRAGSYEKQSVINLPLFRHS